MSEELLAPDPRTVVGSLSVYNIPERMRHCQLANLDWTRTPGAVMPVRLFMDKAVKEESPRLLLTGPAGLGKSHILYGLYRWAITQWDLSRVYALYVPDFCDQVKDGFSDPSGGGSVFEDLKEATKFVGIDDLFGRELTTYELNQVLARVIQISHETGAAVVQTTNYTIEEISNMISPHELSRLLENALVVEFKGESYRLR